MPSSIAAMSECECGARSPQPNGVTRCSGNALHHFTRRISVAVNDTQMFVDSQAALRHQPVLLVGVSEKLPRSLSLGGWLTAFSRVFHGREIERK